MSRVILGRIARLWAGTGPGPRTQPRRCPNSFSTAKPRHRANPPEPGPRPRTSPPRARATPTLIASGTLITGALVAALSDPEPESSGEPDNRDPSLPRYRLSEVRRHGAGHPRPWVTYEDKVYDLTDWVPAHPGGDVILRAAGGSIEPFWDIFSIHKSTHVREILDQYRIGLVHANDLVDGRPAKESVADPFVDDPQRDARLITHTAKPRNAETPPAGLDSFVTPTELFYVRNHMWVPKIEGDGGAHRLAVELLDGTVKEYTVEELKTRFPRHRVTATLQCSGNRRWDMTWQVGKTNGLQWNVGAISNAEWEGVRLSDVLADAGFPVANHETAEPGAKHVQFSALEAYGASIPLHKALDPRGDVLLAYAMNGKPLSPDHGFPLRALVPGNVAARSVKWLSRIVVSDEESTTQWQRRDYKLFCPGVAKPDWDSAPAIQEMPVTSAITDLRIDPRDRPAAARGEPARATMAGYAYSGGGREIIRVDLSPDTGETWTEARLLDADAPRHGARTWTWKRWEYTAPLEFKSTSFEGAPRCVLYAVKATDESYNTQPRQQCEVYNARGNLATGWNIYLGCLDEKSEGGVRRMKGYFWKQQNGKGKKQMVLIKDDEKAASA